MPWPFPVFSPVGLKPNPDVVAPDAAQQTAPRRLRWTTPNKVVLELRTVRLRKFSPPGQSRPLLICAPYALHNAQLADFAPQHSLVAALAAQGRGPIYVTEWRSAAPERQDDSIDTLLSDLDSCVGHIRAPLDVIGICQGGWMSAVYAARFPGRISKLVLAGAPIDLDAAPSPLSSAARLSPRQVYTGFVENGGGLSLGREALVRWGQQYASRFVIAADLQIPAEQNTPALRRLADRFRAWYATTVDLPGVYYLQVVDWLYRENRLAKGAFVALGQTIDLAAIEVPIFLLAARDDQIVAIDQLMAIKRLVSTPPNQIEEAVVDGPHLSLFMGRQTLKVIWPRVAAWLAR